MTLTTRDRIRNSSPRGLKPRASNSHLEVDEHALCLCFMHRIEPEEILRPRSLFTAKNVELGGF